MAWTELSRSERVAAALHGTSGRIVEQRQGLWVVRSQATRRRLHVELTPNWLSLALPVRAAAPSVQRTRRMLRRNAALQDGIRLVARHTSIERCIELPCAALAWDRRDQLEALLAASLAQLGRPNARSPRAIRGGEVSTSEATSQALGTWLEAAAWPARQCDPLEVALEVPGAFVPARVTEGQELATLRVAMLERELGPDPCRDAVETLVWLTASSTRMVRPLLDRDRLHLEVELIAGLDEVSALASACEALSTTLQQCWHEVEVLAGDRRVAQIYMENFLAAA